MTFKWIMEQTARSIQSHQIAEHGGQAGIRDEGLLLSAIEAPKIYHLYQPDSTIPELAAIYANRLIKNHPFIDGNKRTAYVVSRLFLRLHQSDFTNTQEERVIYFWKMAEGVFQESEIIDWFRENTA